jgi:hypothetical protein
VHGKRYLQFKVVCIMNKNYDSQFKKIKNLKWLPWIGDNYSDSSSKLLIVGESHYLWKGEKDADKELNSKYFTRDIVFNNHQGHLQEVGRIKPLDSLEKVFTNNRELSMDYKKLFSDSYSYCVLIQRGLASIEERPCRKDFILGWNTLSNIIRIICPKTIIFIGVTSANYLCPDIINPLLLHETLTKEKILINRTYPRKCIFSSSLNNRIRGIFIKHTSKYFSYNKWNHYIKRYFDIDQFVSESIKSKKL